MILLTNNEGKVGCAKTADMLNDGAHALDAIEAGVRIIESDETVRTVGRGGYPNLLGTVQLDAGVMDGTTLRTGAVGAIEGFLHPISIARRVLDLLPHELLVGPGAERFAREIGAEAGDNLIEEVRASWERWFAAEVPAEKRALWPDVPLADLCSHTIDPETGSDTTVFLAKDSAGNICAGTSTSGWGWKYPGRLGDSPIVGAGFYADSAYGACACTGAGEMAIRSGTARAVVAYMRFGAGLSEAVDAAIEDMARLKTGLLSRVTIHAIDNRGNHRVVAVNGAENTYWYWEPSMEKPEERKTEIVQVSPRILTPRPQP